ncbi:MAG: hypothetical protein FWC76_04220 [Defluviitaleaceae bacterium]|nr:hypothetical protein [Defluviitaleaceae bacterium]
MGKKPLKPGQLRRVGGIMLFSMAVGMLFTLIFPTLSIFLSIVFFAGGLYFLFM